MSLTSGALNRAEADLGVHIKKATSTEESAPKRKHVRACIVYSWDHRSGRAFWTSLKSQPLHTDDVQMFKALITMHKVLQEGHLSVLRDAQHQVTWIESLGRTAAGHGGSGGYSRLISEYVSLLLKKLDFHRHHADFNGTFEYQEYLSLRQVNDPNEGYEAVIDLMNLQDAIDDFQRLVFANLKGSSRTNECKISALTPMVAESYGIFRFTTSMLRALHHTTNDDEALEPLRQRFLSQYNRLLDFYYDCSTLKYLTSLITIPKLGQDPPNLLVEDDDEDNAPALPRRPLEIEQTGATVASTPAPISTPAPLTAEPTGTWWLNNEAQHQAELQAQLEAQRQAEHQAQLQAQAQYEAQLQAQHQAQQQAQHQLMADQLQRQAQGRVAELERDILALRGQHEQSQLLLEQYDGRVKALETELQQLNANHELQLQSKTDLATSLQEQSASWRSKYEALAKLYSQLRQEHLDLLARFKQVQAKAASAQEAIDKRERLERDLKAKNLELADLIRERDRARYELDKAKGGNRDALERLERELRLAQDRAADAERAKGADLSLLLSKHERELEQLEQALRAKQRIIDDYGHHANTNSDEVDILHETIASLEQALQDMSVGRQEADRAIDEQIDAVLGDQLQKLLAIVDAVLESGAERVQESVFDADSPMQAGNPNATPPYLQSVVEKASSSATDFSTAFNEFVADGPNGDHAAIISTVSLFCSAVSDLLLNAKGLDSLAKSSASATNVSALAQAAAQESATFFTSLTSGQLRGLDIDDKTERVIAGNVAVQTKLQALARAVDKLAPSTVPTTGDTAESVDRELARAAQAVDAAAQQLAALRNKSDIASFFDVQVSSAILDAAAAVTGAVALLVRAATECQREIVAQGRGRESRADFYKKHSRWTQGLVSAAKAVAGATSVLISAADGALTGQRQPEELVAAALEVSSSTAQLVAASRVRASFMSRTQDTLEHASKDVSAAVKQLVARVDSIRAQAANPAASTDYNALKPHEFRAAAMEQQVEVLKLEQQLTTARNKLFEIRKIEYANQDSELGVYQN